MFVLILCACIAVVLLARLVNATEQANRLTEREREVEAEREVLARSRQNLLAEYAQLEREREDQQ